MQDNETKKWLYDSMKSKGYDLGSYEEFDSHADEEDTRKWLYDNGVKSGLELGSYEEFDAGMGQNTSKAGPKAQEVVDKYDSFRHANAQNRMQELMRKQDNEPKPKKTLQDIVAESSVPVEQNILNREPISKAPAYSSKSEERIYRPDVFDRMKYDSSIRDEDASVGKEYTPKVEEKEEDVFENYRNRFGLTQRGTELQEELAQIQGDLHNKYSQEFENTPEYKAIVGKKYNTKEEIDAANKALNDAYNKKYGAVINKEMEPYLKAYEGEIYQRYAPRIQEGLRTVAKNDTSKEVKSLTGEVDDLLEKQHKILRSKGPSSGNVMNALMGSTAYNQSTARDRQELGALEASQKLLEQSQEIIEEAGKKGNTNFFTGLGRGFRDNMDIENFTFGLSEMADSKYLNRALEKAEKGEKLTPAEEKLLEASVVNMATYGYFSSDLGRGYGAGSTTAVSLPFMLEFIANPISGSGNAIAKGLLKFGLRKFGIAPAQAAGKGALNAFGRGITSNAGKFTGRLAGDAVAALGMEGTTGLGRVAAGTLGRLNENYDYSLDDNGQLQVQKTGDTSIGGAFARSAASTFFENQSEMVFNAFKGWSPFMKAVDKALPGRMNEFLNRIKNSKPGQLYRELKNNPTFKEIVESAQFHGQGEEYLEEVYNNLANVAMGEMTMDDALDLDNNIDTFLGLAPTSVMFGLLGLGSMAADRYSNRRKMRTAFGKMTPEQQVKLTELTQMSKERGNEDIKNFIESTIADTDLTPEQKRDEIEYAFELAKQNAIEDLQQEQAPEERAADDAYIQGTEMPVEQRYSANQERIAAEESLRQVDENALNTIDRLLADDASMNEVNEVLSGMEEQTATLARDYYNKSVRINGVVDSAWDDAQEAGDAFEANFEKAVVTDESGNRTVTTATLMSGAGEVKEEVYVIANDGVQATILQKDGAKKMVNSGLLKNVQTSFANDVVQLYQDQIGEQMRDQTDMSLNHHPKTQVPQPGMQLWNGGIPLIITEVNADGSVRAFPAVLDSKTGQMELKNGSTPVDMSVKESLDLQDDYYNKMDATANGTNVSENEVQNAISPSDREDKVSGEVVTQPVSGKTEITEVGRHSTENVQPSQGVEQSSSIVMKEDGTPDFVATGEVNSLGYLNDRYKEKTLRKIEVTKDAYAKDLEKASVALEKAQTTFDDAPIGREAKAEEALQKAKQAYDSVKRESDFWTSLYEIAKIDAKQPGDKIAEEIRAMGEPMDGRELASEMLASGRLPLLYSDYKRETGFGENEAKGLFGLFKSKDNGGLSIKKAGEVLMLTDQEAGSNFFDPDDANAGRNAILDVLSSVRTRGGLIDYVKNNREAMAERERAAEQEYEEEQREAWTQENFGMSYADYITYEEVINDIIQEKALSKEAIQEFYNNFAEELNNWNNGRITEETTINERGSVDSGSESSEGLLSTEQLSDNRGIETDISAEADGRADNKGVPASEESIITEIKDAREQVDTNPSDAQKEAGNYKKGHIKLDGYDITIENPKGSERSGTDRDGNSWSITMNNDYGYICGTESVDGDHIDIFLSDNPVDGKVYVIDQINEDGSFDEHKVMYGFNSTDEARDAYLSNYSPGWKGVGTISEVSKDEFKKWIDSSHRKTKPFSDYKGVETSKRKRRGFSNLGKGKQIGQDGENEDAAWEELADIEQKWEDRILDYIAEHYPTQATVSAYTNSPEGLKEKEAMKNDETLKRMRAEADAEFNAANEKVLSLSNQGNITSKSTSPQKNSGEVAENLPQGKSTTKNKKRTADIKRARYELMDAKRELSVAQSTNSGYTPEEVEEKKKRVEKAENELKQLTNTKNAFLGESDFILKRVDEAFQRRKDKSMSKEEWGYTDEAITVENEASDSYSSYIKDLANSGELQKMYDNSSIGERIQIREGIETAGLEVDDLIDTSKEKEEAKKKRDAKKKKQSEELMKKLGIYDEGVRFRIVHHGTGASFDKFTTEKIGTGEGNAAFGWGLYFTEKKDIAMYYANMLGSGLQKSNLQYELERAKERLPYVKGDVKKDTESHIQYLEKQIADLQTGKHLYDVEIPDDGYINWDKAIPKEQKRMIQEQAEKERISFSFYGDVVSPKEYFEKAGRDLEGFQLYKSLTDALGSDKAASLFLNRAGFNGIEYEAGRHSANKKGNEMNFVVFDENAVRIIDHLRYRFMGEQGAANLDKAEEATTRMDNLNVAREMEAAFNAKKERIEKLRKSGPVEITGEEYKGKYELNRDSAQKYILDNLRGEYNIDDTGEKIKISKKGAKKVTSHSQGNEAHMKSIVAIPELIRNSIFIEEQPAYKEKAQYDSYRYYVVGLKIGEEDYTVRITIGVKNGEFYYDHYLTEIEKGNLIEVAQSFKPTEDAPNPSYAKNKDSILLSILQTNDKENAKKIKMATGWERGADGKWRYEVEDFEVDSEGLARKNRLWSNLSWGKEYDLLSDKLFDGIELTEEESSRFDELAEKANDLRKSYQANDKRYLDDYVKDDRLFKAYPELKQIRVELYNAPTSNTGATYYESQNLIRVNESALNHEDFRSILAHEVQHAVQAIEGFARGGNRMTYRRYLDALKEKRDAWSMLEEFDRKREELGKDASQIDVYNALRDEYLSDGFNFGDGFIPSRTAFDNGFNLWVRGYDKEGYEDSYDEYQHLINKFGLGFDNDRYKELSGEVESRNVQSRMNMTPEERRNTLASETEDVSREDQIFLNDAFSSTSLSALLIKEDTNQGQIIQSVEDLSGKLNTPVRIARSLDEIPDESAKHAIEEGRKVKAWFDTGTREVFLYLPNADSVDDAKASVLHEIVAHRGLRNLFGTKNESEFDTIMMDLFEKLPLDVRSEIADIAVSRYASNVSIAMDEYLAEQAEKDETPGWWDRVVSAIRDFFRKMGVDVQLSENDVKYLLWRSRKKLESGDFFEHARDVVMRNKLGIDSAETQKASESVPKEGTRFRIVGGIFDSAGKDVEVVERETGNARGMYERTLQTAGYKMRESWQDSMLGLKEAQDAIAKVTHSRILDYENAYMAENALSSRSLAEINAYRELVYKPILEEIARMKKLGAKYEDISDYLITKHGIERNREMAVRKALAEDENIERWTEDKKNIWNNDSMSWREKQEELDRIAASYGADMNVDYSGLSAMFPNDDMEETTAEAYKAVEDFEGKFETAPLLDKVKAATTATLDKQRDSGLMNKDTYKSIQDMYQFYVPLRGWEEKTADEVYDYITSETPVFNAPLKTAKGRTSKSDDPLPTIANIAESGILQGNRNLMKQKFLTMVENHPSNLVSVSELWVKYDTVNDKWTAIFPEIPNNASAEEVENIVSQFNARMEELSKNNPDEYKKASDARDIPYKILPNNLKEHQVIVKRNGKEYVLTINGNPRAAQALNGLTNPNATDNPVIKAFEATNRFLAANFTQRNPAFVISNMFRDGFYSNSVIWVKESPLYAKKYNKNWAKSLKEMGGLVKRYKTNSLDMNNDTDRMFLEFINNGGETGYTFINSVEEYKGIIAKELKKQNRSKLAPGKAFDILGEAMDTFGRWAEDTSRFAAYRTSREMGRSIARSISDAKEISVNFNKKGAGAKTAGKWEKGNRMNALQAWTSQTARGLYIFWNAGVQGLTNFARLAKRNPGKFAGLASSYFVLGGMMPVINAALASAMGGDGDEDDYYNLPEYVRRNNICIYMGGEWLTIPLPIELKAIYGLGELACGLLSGKENMTGWKLTKKVAEQVSQIMPIDMMEGGGGFSAFVPSYVKPVYEVWTNKDWTGIPIYRKNDFNKNMPGWTKAYSSTSPELVKLSEIINEWTGGNKYKTGMIDFNPAIVEHLFESYLGGVGTTINQLKKTLMMPFDEDLQELRNAPVLSRFMRSADSRSVQKRIDEEYFNNRDRFELIRQEVNGYKKELENPQMNDFDYAKYQTLYNKMINSDEYRKYIEFKEMDKVLKKMRDAFKQSGNEELEAQMFLLKEAMNEVSK